MPRYAINILIPAAVVLALWQYAGSASTQISFFFSKPSLVAWALWKYLAGGLLIKDFVYTAGPTIAGFLISSIIGTVVGLLLSFENSRSAAIRTYISVLSNFPVFAVAPMMIVWFGIGLEMKLALAIFSTIFVSIAQAYEGARNVSRRQKDLFGAMGATQWQMVRHLLLPSSISWTLSGMRVTSSLALLGTFLGEFMASEAGLGHRMLKAGSLYDISLVLACSVAMVGLVLGLNGIVFALRRVRSPLIQFLSVDRSLWAHKH
jgi:NitT/TauT family transport system permease protein